MVLFAIYLKFYYHKIETIHNWDYILSNIDYDLVNVYIWIFYKVRYQGNITNIFLFENIKNIMKKYPKCVFISNCNEIDFLTISEQNYLGEIYNVQTKFIDNHWKGHADSHLKAFMIPKNVEYIFKFDADDMFYPNFKISYFFDCIYTMKKNDLIIITRPYWQCVNRGWSFGFTVARKNILEYMDVLNYIKNDNDFSKGPLTDLCFNTKNLDTLFAEIFQSKNVSLNNLFFKFSNYNWDNNKENDYIYENNCLIVETTT
jgi:hypothetical protein